MTRAGVPDDDMPNFPWPGRRNPPEDSDEFLAGLLAGHELPGESGPGLQPVAELLAALRAAPAGDELAGEATVLAQFRQRSGVSPSPRPSRRRRPTVLTSLLSAKLATVGALAALGLGGIATAAYAGTLPAPLQRLAHDSIGAPASHPGAHPSTRPSPAHSHLSTPAGPDATGAAAYGLCTAYAHAKAHGSATQRAVAFRNLEAAAGGASKVSAYCATVPHPGASPSGAAASASPGPAVMPSHSANPHAAGAATSHPAGAPTSHPTGAPTSHPTGAPTSHPTGAPTSHPAGAPSNA